MAEDVIFVRRGEEPCPWRLRRVKLRRFCRSCCSLPQLLAGYEMSRVIRAASFWSAEDRSQTNMAPGAGAWIICSSIGTRSRRSLRLSGAR